MDYHKMALAYMASSQYETDTDSTKEKSHCFVPDLKYDTLKYWRNIYVDCGNTTFIRNHRCTKYLAARPVQCMCDWRWELWVMWPRFSSSPYLDSIQPPSCFFSNYFLTAQRGFPHNPTSISLQYNVDFSKDAQYENLLIKISICTRFFVFLHIESRYHVEWNVLSKFEQDDCKVRFWEVQQIWTSLSIFSLDFDCRFSWANAEDVHIWIQPHFTPHSTPMSTSTGWVINHDQYRYHVKKSGATSSRSSFVNLANWGKSSLFMNSIFFFLGPFFLLIPRELHFLKESPTSL